MSTELAFTASKPEALYYYWYYFYPYRYHEVCQYYPDNHCSLHYYYHQYYYLYSCNYVCRDDTVSVLLAERTITCFECRSTEDVRCHDPFNYTLHKRDMPKTRECKGCCVKMLLFIGTGEHNEASFSSSFSALASKDSFIPLYRALPGASHVHGRVGRQLLHGQPRLHDRGTPPWQDVFLRDRRVQRRQRPRSRRRPLSRHRRFRLLAPPFPRDLSCFVVMNNSPPPLKKASSFTCTHCTCINIRLLQHVLVY